MNKRRVSTGPVSRHQVLAKYWDLANLDPEVTKGSIAGQLKALDSLLAELLVVEGEPKAALRAAGVYRAAWMPEPGREN